MVVAEGMGACEWPSDAGCVERSSRSPGVWLSFCTGCGSMVASSGGGSTAPRFLRLPEAAAENAGKLPSRRSTRSASAEKCPHGDDGWGEFVAPADPAANLRQRRPTDWTSPSSHPIMRRPDADLEEKREPRVTGEPKRKTAGDMSRW